MKLSVVMLTYNRLGSTMRCLRSLRPWFAHDDVQWLIDDNASTDGTGEWLLRFASHTPNVELTLHTHNLGVAGGRVQQLERVTGDYVLIIDSDVEATSFNWLHRLRNALDRSAVGIVGVDGWRTTKGWGKERVAPDYEGEVDTVSGYCQMFKRSLLQYCKIDERFNGHGSEDDDFCIQALAEGLLVYRLRYLGLEHYAGGLWDKGTVSIGRRLLRDKWDTFMFPQKEAG